MAVQGATKAGPALAMADSRPIGDCRAARCFKTRSGPFSVSGISPPRALAKASPALSHVLEKFDMRQVLKWCAAVLMCCDAAEIDTVGVEAGSMRGVVSSGFKL
ncbi:hypothetical protein [Mesorhizobium wenxiniae]|uniref:hypothetical protein n=1 Tax=Mesorhizobium wenxiniae TaxID=2014805 RepID=UPI001055B9E8|nr:hypothetical protein [Mesorhizobium wenxiniae]